MKDTHPTIEKIYLEMMMKRSGEERLQMGCSMFDAAKEIVKASILNENPNISNVEMRQKIFLRFYGDDFNLEHQQKILSAMSERE